MERLIIRPTKSTPEVVFDPEKGVFSIYGSSYPENAYDFYIPIIDWVDNFVNENPSNELEVNVKMQYFDTSSSKCLLVIFEKLESYHKKGNIVNVNWLYDEDDHDSIESAEELFTGLNLPRRIIKG